MATSSLQLDQTRRSRLEPTGIEVERCERFVEVDVDPLATRRPSAIDGQLHDSGSDALPSGVGCDQGVENEGVHTAVPRQIHEPDQRSTVSGADPSETVSIDLRSPIVIDGSMIEPLGMERVEFGVVEGSAPLVGD